MHSDDGTRRTRNLRAALMSAATGLLVLQGAAGAQDAKPYDDQLMRLAEILGAVHYLRELCSANDGQLWRDHMQTLINAETPSAQRKARIARSFNQGYRSYSRTYTTCTPSAQTAIGRFMSEGAEISDSLAEKAP